MIFEPIKSKIDLKEIVKGQKFKDNRGHISCGHDFWDKSKSMDFGDIILCTRCNQYFTKIKHLPWITIKKKWLSSEITGYGTNHLNTVCFIPVSVRVTD